MSLRGGGIVSVLKGQRAYSIYLSTCARCLCEFGFEEQRRNDGVASDLLRGSVITFDSFFFMQKVSISEKRTIFAKHEFVTSFQREIKRM